MRLSQGGFRGTPRESLRLAQKPLCSSIHRSHPGCRNSPVMAGGDTCSGACSSDGMTLTVSAKTPKAYKLESGVNWDGVGDHAAGSANISLCHISYILLIHCLKETLHLSAHLSQVSPVLKYRRGYIILFDCEYIILYRFWGMNFTSCRIWPFDIKLLERAQIKIQTNKQTNKQNPNTLVLALCCLLWASHFTS